MLYHIAIHRPFPDKAHLLLQSMHRFGATARMQPGLKEVHALKDAATGALVGFAIWESREALMAARPALSEAVKNDPFTDWEPAPPQVMLLEEV
jgi:hypothetical protein